MMGSPITLAGTNERDEATLHPPIAGDLPQPPLRSIHTSTFAQILAEHNVSLAVTTYQAGKLVLLRAEQGPSGPVLNTHFRNFNRPMGFAADRGRFAIGTKSAIWEFRNIPAVAAKIASSQATMKTDAAFLPRSCH